MQGMDLAREVTTPDSYEWHGGSWDLDQSSFQETEVARHVVAYDFGVKRNILRMLADRACRITVVPASTKAEEVLALNPDGVFLSNGPGDPQPCDYAISAIGELSAQESASFWYLPWAPVAGPGGWRHNHEDEIRSPRGQSPGAGPG